jgi:phosphatidylserine decarboxylase
MAVPLKNWIDTEVARLKKIPKDEFNGMVFHRDPLRIKYIDSQYFFSPADGTILYQKVVRPDEEIIEVKGKNYTLRKILANDKFNQSALVIGIFLSQYDVHISRLPFGGYVTYKKLDKIETLNRPMLDEERDVLRGIVDYDDMEYVFTNERVLDEVWVNGLNYKYFVMNIADAEIDVVSHFFGSGKPCTQNSRLATIRWGSQVDLIIPLPAPFDYKLLVPNYYHVEAGVDKLIQINIIKKEKQIVKIEKARGLPAGSKRKFGPNWYTKLESGKWQYIPTSEHEGGKPKGMDEAPGKEKPIEKPRDYPVEPMSSGGTPAQKYLWFAINQPIDNFGKNRIDEYLTHLGDYSASLFNSKRKFNESYEELLARDDDFKKRINDIKNVSKYIKDNKQKLIDAHLKFKGKPAEIPEETPAGKPAEKPKDEVEIPSFKNVPEDLHTSILDKQWEGLSKENIEEDLNEYIKRSSSDQTKGKTIKDYDLKKVPVNEIKPSQKGEDYVNESSKETARSLREKDKDIRYGDVLPIIVDENNKIIDGNHRHASAVMNNQKYIYALIPKDKKEPSKPEVKPGAVEKPTEEQKAEAVKKLSNVKKLMGDSNVIDVLEFLPYEEDTDVLRERNKYVSNHEWNSMDKKFNKAETETVNISDLIATQDNARRDNVKKIIENKENIKDIPIQVIKYKDKYYVSDGHHRLIASKLLGKKETQAKILDMDNKGNFKPHQKEDPSKAEDKTLPIGTIRTHADGTKWKKVGDDKWEQVTEGSGKKEKPEVISDSTKLPKGDISDESKKWLLGWAWKKEMNTRPPQKVIDEFAKFKPDKPVKLYRGVIHGDEKNEDKKEMRSYTYEKGYAMAVANVDHPDNENFDDSDPKGAGTLEEREVSPDEILIDTTKIPGVESGSDLDLKGEVIVMKKSPAGEQGKAEPEKKNVKDFKVYNELYSKERLTTGVTLSLPYRSSLKRYCGNAYEYINNYLRYGKQNTTDNEVVINHIKRLDAIFKVSKLEQNIKVWRGIDLEKMQDLSFTDKKVGDVFIDKGYSSTSRSSNPKDWNFDQKKNFIKLEINVPKGYPAIDINQHKIHDEDTILKDEREILLNRRTKYKITGIDIPTMTYKCEVVFIEE